ncbi:hypothetical protein ABSL23_03745 [Halobacterium sp. NMX12-1]|uniref:DUF1102 domain-containing protein n=1 Tax=Halobacterium sp. NMX12-1 TaxID=3166650 RepID=A0AAU8CG08_9EURY
MKRRTLIAGLGSLTASGVFAVGSGAFTSVSAARTVTVDVADDDRALLALDQRGTGERSDTDGLTDSLEFQIPGSDGDEYPAAEETDPAGVGTDSVYRFADDAASDQRGLFAVTNRGTQPVEVYSTQETTEGVPSVVMYDVETGDRLTETSPSTPLSVGGEPLLCGLEVDTHDVPAQPEAYDVTLTITAVATDSD